MAKNIERAGLRRTAKVTPDGDRQPVIIQKLDVRPIARISQDIEKWRAAIRAAEGITPRRTKLYDLYHDILLDTHLSSVVEKRVLQILNTEWVFVDENEEEVKEINAWIDTPHFETLLRELVNAKIWGYTMVELDFSAEDGPGTFCIPRKHIRPHTGEVAIRQHDHGDSQESTFNVREGRYADTVLEAGDADDLGLLVSVAQFVIYKRGNVADWAQFNEVFGMPVKIGKWDGFDTERYEKLRQAFDEMGGNGSLIVPEGTEVEMQFGSTANPTGELYERFTNLCDRQISIRILGQTETTTSSESSGYAQAKQHGKTEDDINRADRRFVRRILNKRVKKIFEAHGIDLGGGEFRIKDEQDDRLTKKDLFEMSLRMKNEGMVPVSDDHFYELVGVDKPEDYEALKAEIEERAAQHAAVGFQTFSEPERKSFLKRLRSFFEAPGSGATRNMSLTELYGEAAGDVTIKLAATGIDEDLVRKVFEGRIPKGMVDVDHYLAIAETLNDALNEGLASSVSDRHDRAAVQVALQHNLFSFAGHRTYDRQLELSRMMTGEGGGQVSYAEFRRRVVVDGEVFNDAHLRAEYNNAKRTAQAADKWFYLQKFDALEYRTAGDERVRDSHRALHGKVFKTTDRIWDTIYPPNGWNCRCTVIPAQGKEAEKGSAYRQSAKDTIAPYFRKNAGKELTVFREDHPVVYRVKKSGEWGAGTDLSAVRNYGLPSAEEVYRRSHTLPEMKVADDREAVKAAFRERDVVAADGVTIHIGEDFRRKIIEGLNRRGKEVDAYLDRFRFADLVDEVLQAPDEIWSQKHNKEIQTLYFKWYRNNPLVFITKLKNGRLNFESFFDLDRGGLEEIDGRRRKGVLKKYKRK